MAVSDRLTATQGFLATVESVDSDRGVVTVKPNSPIYGDCEDIPVLQSSLSPVASSIASPEVGALAFCITPSDGSQPVVVGYVQPPGSDVPTASPGDIRHNTEGGAEVLLSRDGSVALRSGPGANILMLPSDGIIQAFAAMGFTFETPDTKLVLSSASVSSDSLGGTALKLLLRIGSGLQRHLTIGAGGELGTHFFLEAGAGVGKPKWRMQVADEVVTEVEVPLTFTSSERAEVVVKSLDLRATETIDISAPTIRIKASQLELVGEARLSTSGKVVSLGGTVILLGGDGANLPLLNPALLLAGLQGHYAKPPTGFVPGHPDPASSAMVVQIPTIKVRGG